MSLSFSKKETRESLIRQSKPIRELGLTFYPIKMPFYEQFLYCKEALLLRQSTLPVKYIAKNYVDAIFAMEMDSLRENNSCSGMFYRLIMILAMALGIDIDVNDYINGGNVLIKKDKHKNDTVVFKMTQDGETVEISSLDFSTKLRRLIATQNGLELPEETDNTELIEAQNELQKLNNKTEFRVNQNIDDLIASVAYLSNIREREIQDWTVREFENRRKAIERNKMFTLYAQAELSGMITFKNGNPYVSWCFDTINDNSGTMPLAKLGEQLGNISEKTKT